MIVACGLFAWFYTYCGLKMQPGFLALTVASLIGITLARAVRYTWPKHFK
jgi:hypothetical protein